MPEYNSRRFFLLFGAALFLLALATCLVITLVDPNRYFFGSPLPTVVANSRRDKIELFQRYQAQAPVTGLIFGSSRSMLLSPEYADRLTGLRFFNAAVMLGAPEDFLAEYRVFRDFHAAPRVIVIGIDPASLGSHTSAQADFLANYLLVSHLNRSYMPRPFHYLKLYKEAFCLQTFTGIVTSVGLMVHPVDEGFPIYPNGRTVFVRWDRQMRDGTYDRRGILRLTTEGFMESNRNFRSLSKSRLGYLESLVREASSAGVRVVLWQTPEHPELRDRISLVPGLLAAEQEARNAVSEIGRRYNVRVCDLSDPESYGSDIKGWYDANHSSKNDVPLILDRLLGLPYDRERPYVR